ncbi:MAG: DUF2924 domain-containing protein [Rickettsiales bacterium]|nr:DUF2924 domain-containing protein [Rickettsiales bacterium]
MSKSIIRQIIELEGKSAAEIRQIYNEIMPKKCAANANKEYLRPRVAYRLQELSLGALGEETRAKLLKIAGGISINTLRHHSDLIAGTKICREWGGVMHEVEVLKDCFEYQGQKFKSLSSIAGKVTGTKWNGPKFFKLKS